MEPVSFLLFIIGLMIGLISASLGIGGGIFTVPALFFTGMATGLPESSLSHMAIGTSLLMAAFLSLSAAGSQLKSRNVSIKTAMYLVITSIPAAFLGASIASYVDSVILMSIFSTLLIVNAIISIVNHKKSNRNYIEVNNPSNFRLIAISGVPVGIISSLTGIGGGVILVPLFHYIGKLTIHSAIATSNLAIIFTSLAGAAAYLGADLFSKGEMPDPSIGFIYLPFAIPLLLGGLSGGYAGASLMKKVNAGKLKLFFSFFQISVALYMIYRIFFAS